MYFTTEQWIETTAGTLEAIEAGRIKTLSQFSNISTEDQYTSIIERILLRLPLGHVVMKQEKDNTLIPVENGIILEAINAFVNDGFHLTNPLVMPKYLSYNQLDVIATRRFKSTQINFAVLSKNNTEEEMEAALAIIQNIKK